MRADEKKISQQSILNKKKKTQNEIPKHARKELLASPIRASRIEEDMMMLERTPCYIRHNPSTLCEAGPSLRMLCVAESVSICV